MQKARGERDDAATQASHGASRARPRGRLRYARLFAIQLRTSLTLAAQYRWEFVAGGVISVLWNALALVPLWIAFRERPALAGWTFEQSMVVLGWFALLKGILDGAVSPSLLVVVDHIRKGTLDFVLLKPADAQFLASTARFEAWKVVDVALGIGILAAAFALMGTAPTAGGVALATLIFGAAVLVLYSIWILVVSAAFWVVRLDNLAYFFDALFDFARWPASVFRGVWRFVFTYVVPLALMTTYPAEALLGTLSARTAAGALAGAGLFAAAGRAVFRRAIRHYTSASS